MEVVGARRSCRHCSGAKRKCDRAVPSCRLCRRKKLECVYPPRKPSRFVPIESENTTSIFSDLESNLLDFEAMNDALSLSFLAPALDNQSSSTVALDVEEARHRGAWFLEPDSFLVDHRPMPIPLDFQISDLYKYIGLFQEWMVSWVKTCHNPFIHPKLYRHGFPHCLQTAFTTYSAYISRTPDNRATILGIVNDQANIITSMYDAETDTSSPLLDDIARIHALLAYQIISLFDGDIRSRHLAEKRTPYLTMFMDSALEKARRFGKEQIVAETTNITVALCQSAISDESLWQLWIISESLRRTWLISAAVICGYEAIKEEWTSCYGDLLFTHGVDLWSADSASAWTKLVAERDVLFLGRFDGERLFKLPERDVDEFSKLMLELTFGKQRYAEWLHRA
ncbi:unnamed protein product [Periconia digitata]|uniref:Zn(2)-C6 fungal-type domain-containing protein n=1 Tax=Periconia digitata TaxID=1303443 RepID=A0A9W4XY60_9PLEO|nr:unnamed protein product [Periconia digitata]